MSVPSAPSSAHVQQSSIRSFFQPRTPVYSPPPSIENTTSPINAPPPQSISPPRPSASAASVLPQQATIAHVDPSHIQPLRRINSLLLPVNYPDAFYHKILDPNTTPSFSRVILWQDTPSSPPKVVGGIVCRLDPSIASDSTPKAPKFIEGVYDVYVQSLVLLSPYRGHGLAAAALKSVIDAGTDQIRVKIASLYAHVWTENTEGLEWYAARGFSKDGQSIDGYYKRLKPDSAWILRKRLGVSDHLSATTPLKLPLAPASVEVQAPLPPICPKLCRAGLLQCLIPLHFKIGDLTGSGMICQKKSGKCVVETSHFEGCNGTEFKELF